MRLPGMGNRLPGAVVSMLGIPRSERVVAWGSDSDETQTAYVAATDRALYLSARGERIPWDRISKASWDEPVLEIVVVDDAGRPERVLVRMDDEGEVPAAVHDRVTASVVVSEWVDLAGGKGARLVARRASDDDAVRWSVVFDSGLDPSDPSLRQAAHEALSRLRDSLGI